MDGMLSSAQATLMVNLSIVWSTGTVPVYWYWWLLGFFSELVNSVGPVTMVLSGAP